MQENQGRQNPTPRQPVRPAATRKSAPAQPRDPAPRRALSPKEKAQRERRRAEAQERQRQDQERRRQAAKRARRALGVASLVLAILFVALYWIFVAVSISGRSRESGYPLLVYTEGELQPDHSFKAEEVVFHGTTYLPLTCFQEYFTVTVYGSGSTRSFLMASGDEAKFFLGTDQAQVNGQRVSLSDVSFLRDEVLYLPVDFFTDKMNCFRFSYISDKGSNALTFDPTVTPAMTFRGQVSSPKVDPGTVPATTQAPPVE